MSDHPGWPLANNNFQDASEDSRGKTLQMSEVSFTKQCLVCASEAQFGKSLILLNCWHITSLALGRT